MKGFALGHSTFWDIHFGEDLKIWSKPDKYWVFHDNGYLRSNRFLGISLLLGKIWELFGKFLGNLYSVVFKE